MSSYGKTQTSGVSLARRRVTQTSEDLSRGGRLLLRVGLQVGLELLEGLVGLAEAVSDPPTMEVRGIGTHTDIPVMGYT